MVQPCAGARLCGRVFHCGSDVDDLHRLGVGSGMPVYSLAKTGPHKSSLVAFSLMLARRSLALYSLASSPTWYDIAQINVHAAAVQGSSKRFVFQMRKKWKLQAAFCNTEKRGETDVR